jgi:hypothetical protein
MNKEQQQIINEAYENYKTIHKHAISTEGNRSQLAIESLEKQLIYPQEEFISKIKTNPEFSEKWGLKIEERELNLDERAKLHSNTEMFYDICATHFSIQDSIEYSNYPDKIWLHEQFTKGNIPTKLITITYNNETIESYEYNR